MKLKHLAAVVAVATLTLAGCDSKSPEPKTSLKTPVEKFSYGLGLRIGSDVKESGVDGLSPAAISAGVADALAGKQQISDEELMEAFQFVQQRAEEKQNALNDAAAQAGREFLEDNAKRDGVQVTESGLQYEVLTATEGKQPKASDTVRVHYTGTLIDGTVFDSSVERGEPVDFPVLAVIPGWVEALQLMHVGEKYKLFVPSDLAYGATSPTPLIPANSTLLFEVELLDILDADSAAGQPSAEDQAALEQMLQELAQQAAEEVADEAAATESATDAEEAAETVEEPVDEESEQAAADDKE